MTKLEKPIRRAVATRYGDLVVEATRSGVRLREKGKRSWFGPVSWDAIYSLAAKQEAAGTMAERAGRRRRGRA